MCRGTSYGQPGAGYSVAARYSAEESNAYALLKALSKDLRNDEITIKPTS